MADTIEARIQVDLNLLCSRPDLLEPFLERLDGEEARLQYCQTILSHAYILAQQLLGHGEDICAQRAFLQSILGWTEKQSSEFRQRLDQRHLKIVHSANLALEDSTTFKEVYNAFQRIITVWKRFSPSLIPRQWLHPKKRRSDIPDWKIFSIYVWEAIVMVAESGVSMEEFFSKTHDHFLHDSASMLTRSVIESFAKRDTAKIDVLNPAKRAVELDEEFENRQKRRKLEDVSCVGACYSAYPC